MLQQLQDSKSSVSKLVETRDEEGNTGFMIAAVQGLRRMCRALLDFSCNVDAQNVEGNTALHLCQIKGQHSMIPFILKKGADPSIANLQGKTYNES
ncbi:hypothetical protein GUITHDRAFT_66725 [Guillardia theta CCMP2712]|uniref:Uncharacterized protein n=2 Tax=Guillardia theta TaxID=55529 RepID=L1JQ63_GUITC|nr:hypothetical protein GUITHDRAFT_66725 [Guillardia theta CCMP2712]EKX50414.1 hypothetical protein GUITHDRAFT_66725 [Guillardia theta CCMP2712]|eukprot:XP_005837394.1 hypothetical protein GUITHDRAFT_66725 [Guillardia theta CCMP2712]